MIKIRYCLVPYLYSEFLRAALNNEMMFRPLGFDFRDDADAKQAEDQLLLGNEIMIAPIYKQNANGRYVYLPEEMMLVRMRAYNDYETEILPKGHHYIPAKLEELIFFIRHGKAVPFGNPAANTQQINKDDIRLLGYSGASYTLYSDDGISSDTDKTLSITEL